jgi:hypothetical protein
LRLLRHALFRLNEHGLEIVFGLAVDDAD